MSERTIQSAYMHWAKTQRPVRFALSSSEVPHVRMDRLGISIDDLEMDGASHPRYRPLVEAIARHHEVDASQVATAEGTSMATFLAMAATVAPGDEMLFETPGYEPVLAAARFLGADIRRFERRFEDGWQVDVEALETMVSERTRLIFLTNLHNPSSAMIDNAMMTRIVETAARHGADVLVDEVYLDAADPPARSAVHLGPNVLATSSLTKAYGLSGLRCGWILASPAMTERIWRVGDLFSVNRAHQAERLACIAFERLDEVIGDNAERCRANRALFDAFVGSRDDLECISSRHGLTAFPRWTAGDPEKLDELLRERFDTGIVPGRWFEAAEHFRVGLGGDTDMLREGLSRLAEAMDQLR